MALAIGTSVLLFFVQLGFLALLFQVVFYVPWMNAGTQTAQTNRAAYGLLQGDPASAVQRLRLRHNGGEHSAFLLGEAYLALGDDDRARDFYKEALVRARPLGSSSNAPERTPERALVQELAPKRLSILEAELPRLGIRVLDASGGALVAGVSRGGPAFRSGVRQGDVIRSIDGVSVPDRSGLVAELRRRSVGQDVRIEVSRAGRPLRFAVQLGRAAELFAKGCDSGYMEDCASLGTVYERGEGVSVDIPRAADLYRRACEGREPLGCVSLALRHELGGGVAVDLVRAAALYEQSCAKGDVWGCNNLGVLRAKGTGVAKSETGAAELFSRACEAGLPEACANQQLLTDKTFRDERRRLVALVASARPHTR